MFSKQELQLMGKTLMQRREWLIKNIDTPEMANLRTQNQQAIQMLDGIISKLSKQLQNENGESSDQVNHYVSTKPTVTGKQAAQIRRQQMSADQIKVLVVDDDSLLIELLVAILNSAGITKVDTAPNGMRAVTMMFDANPVYDLVLCDWHMPEKNGLEVHTAMRASERYHHAIFMLVTAVTEAKQIRDAIDEGVDDYVVKPLEQDKMLKKISRHFPLVKAS